MGLDELKPRVGVGLVGQGRVVANERVLGHAGRWMGLLKLVIEREDGFLPDLHTWVDMLPRYAVIKLTKIDDLRKGRLIIYYKLEEQQDATTK